MNSPSKRTRLNEIGFGNISLASEDGVDTFYVLSINEHSFVWGNSSEFSEDGEERIHEKLEECVLIVRGSM